MESSSAIVAAQDLHKYFGQGETAVHALDGVTISFMRGQYSSIMGPSGSGKSTLMHCLAGLDRPTSGSVQIDGIEITTLDDKRLTDLRREKIGFIFQAFNLLPVLTAEENITLPLTIAGPRHRPGVGGQADRDRRPHRPAQAPPLRAVRRPAAARRDRARARHAPGCRVRGRAHRQPRLEVERGGAAAAAQRRGRVQPDRRDGHPRCRCRGGRRPPRGAARRAHLPRRASPARGSRSTS